MLTGECLMLRLMRLEPIVELKKVSKVKETAM